jgi:hypothetical protein
VLVTAECIAQDFGVLLHEWTCGVEQFSQAGEAGTRYTLFFVVILLGLAFVVKK